MTSEEAAKEEAEEERYGFTLIWYPPDLYNDYIFVQKFNSKDSNVY